MMCEDEVTETEFLDALAYFTEHSEEIERQIWLDYYEMFPPELPAAFKRPPERVQLTYLAARPYPGPVTGKIR